MTQALNYCRQMTKQFREMTAVPSLPEMLRERMLHCITLAAVSEKFLLPAGGYLIDDQDLRALDESERLRLPFPSIALEYQCAPASEAGRSSTKRIVLASELENGVAFRCVAWMDAVGMFQPYAAFMLEHGNYLRRDVMVEGVPSLLVRDMAGRADSVSSQSERDDCLYEARALLGFINALTCSNVRFERQEPSKVRKAMQKKGALPFDTYHILTIDVPSKAGEGAPTGGHRSPREHLRRGHIRRLADGRRIWVNAAVIGAGRGAGVVTKDYAIKGRA